MSDGARTRVGGPGEADVVAMTAAAFVDARPFFILAGVAAAAFVAVFAVLATVTRPKLPDAGPATAELRPETPAVANFLVNRWKLTASALPATLVDLAARRFLSLESVGDGTHLCRLYQHRSALGELTPYEEKVLRLVRERATAEGTVAAAELSLGQGDKPVKWWKAFESAVIGEARKRGLARPRWSRVQVVILLVALALPFLSTGLGLEAISRAHRLAGSTADSDDFGGGLSAAFVGWLVVAGVGGKKLRAWRDTTGGRLAAAHWLGVREQLGETDAIVEAEPAAVALWDRLLAYGAALGVAHTVVATLPLAPERNDEAWSAFGGRWREVHIRYPKRFNYGQSPIKAALSGLALSAFFVAVLVAAVRVLGPILADVVDALRDVKGPLGLVLVGVVFVVCAGALAWCLMKLIRSLVVAGRGLVDLVSPTSTFEGQIIRLPLVWRSGSDNSPGTWVDSPYTAIDDGRSEVVSALRFRRADLKRGDVVRVTVSRYLRHVSACERLDGHARAATWSAPTPPVRPAHPPLAT